MITAHPKTELVELLAAHAYREGDVGLSSGARSAYYVDGKLVTYRPEGATLVGDAVWDVIRDEGVVGVGGLTLGADAVVISTIFAAQRAQVELTGFIVRKEPKQHGMQKMIEGVIPRAGSRVAIVDDVVTSGRSVLVAITEAEKAGLQVAIVVPLVDREEGAREKVEEMGIKFRPLCTAREVQDVYRRRGR
jgi:orotate phosphoribosyltransferase